jgi:hypothetical protein
VRGPEALVATERNAVEAIATACGGRLVGPGPVESWLHHRNAVPGFETFLKQGMVVDTIEVVVTWDRIDALFSGVLAGMRAVPGLIVASGHSSHTYPTGTNIYFTFAAKPESSADLEPLYFRIWSAAMEATLPPPATISHHHGIGRVRRDWLPKELGSAYDALLTCSARSTLGITNPGALPHRTMSCTSSRSTRVAPGSVRTSSLTTAARSRRPTPRSDSPARAPAERGQPVLLGDIIALNAGRTPNGVALIDGDREITFAHLHERATRLANALLQLASPGDRIAILAQNIAEYVECYYGVPAAGMALTFLNYRLHPKEWAWILANVPGARARAAAGKIRLGTIDTWISWKLSGGASHVTGRVSTSRTGARLRHRSRSTRTTRPG